MNEIIQTITHGVLILITIITMPFVGLYHPARKATSLRPANTTSKQIRKPTMSPTVASTSISTVKEVLGASVSIKPTVVPTVIQNVSAQNRGQERVKSTDIIANTPTQTPTTRQAEVKVIPSQSTPTSTPTLIPTPTTVLSFRDTHCPKVVKIEDSLGNVAYANPVNSNSLYATYSQSNVQQITVTVYATDPQNLPLYYQFGSDAYGGPTGSLNLTDQVWNKDNSITYHVGELSGVTENTHRTWHLAYRVDNQDGYNCSDGIGDVGGYFEYTVTP